MTMVTEARDNHALIDCRCGFRLGRFAGRYPDLTPGIHLVVDVPYYVDLICPACGQRRRLRNIVFSAMTVPPLARGRHATMTLDNQ